MATTSCSLPSAVPRVHVVNVYKDNHSYLIVNPSLKRALAVDPFDATKVFNTAKSLGVEIQAILTTHSHYDHAGGNSKLKKITGADIYASEFAQPVLNNVDILCKDSQFYTAAGLNFQVFHVPFHTDDHVFYYFPVTNENSSSSSTSSAQNATPLVFTGDAIFLAGCGRFFSGTPSQAFKAFSVFRGLDSSTLVYDGHEYTVSNCEFALSVDPTNTDLVKFHKNALEKIEKKLDTCPSTVAEQLAVNPFLRWDSPTIQKVTGYTEPVKVVGKLREMKDNFSSYSLI